MKPTAGIVLFSLLFLGACNQQPAPQSEPAQPQAAAHQEAAENETPNAGSDDNITNPEIAAGEEVYESNCAGCHNSGTGNAPKLGDKESWKALADQSIETLTKRSIEGFVGKNGTMPPKGGNDALSEKEVSNAVKYMAFKSR